jgi:hypothetical protein
LRATDGPQASIDILRTNINDGQAFFHLGVSAKKCGSMGHCRVMHSG